MKAQVEIHFRLVFIDGQNTVQQVGQIYPDTATAMVNAIKSRGDSVMPVLVYVGEDGNRYMLHNNTLFHADPSWFYEAEKAEFPLEKIIKAINENLTDDLLSGAPWPRKHGVEKLAPYSGVTVEALYHALGGAQSGLSVHTSITNAGTPYAWLQRDGHIIDPLMFGADELALEMRDVYRRGERSMFIWHAPSERARILLERIGVNLGDSHGC